MSEGTTPLDHRLRWLLRIAAALCFFGHGVFGTLTKAAWVPYFAVVGIPEESAWRLMPQVGAMDMALGVCALLACRPWLWAWMTAWAMWTAVLRPLAGEPICSPPRRSKARSLTARGTRELRLEPLENRSLLAVSFSLGSAGQEYGKALTVDSANNAIVASLFQNTVDFDPGAGTANLGAGQNGIKMALTKYASDGSLVWARGIAGSTGPVTTIVPHGVTTDGANNVYVAGYFGVTDATPGSNTAVQSTVDFDPGSGTLNLTNTGERDPFIAKFDAGGNLLWAKIIGNTAFNGNNLEERAWDIAVDASGSVYWCGFFNGTYDFDLGTVGNAKNPGNPGSHTFTSQGGNDAFLIKYDTNGNYAWGFGLGGTGTDEGLTVAVDSSNHVFFSGRFSSTVDFDPGVGTANLTSAGGTDLFIARYDATTGIYQQAVRIGNVNSETSPPGTLRLDAAGNLYVTGRFRGVLDLNPGAGVLAVTNTNTPAADDAFIASYTNDLTAANPLRWGFSLASDGDLDGAHRTALDNQGNLYIAGWHSGTTDFDGGAGTFSLSSANGTAIPSSGDVFLAKYSASTGTFQWARGFGVAVSDQTNDSIAAGLAVDQQGNPWITGQYYGNVTADSAGNALGFVNAGLNDTFVVKYNPNGAMFNRAPDGITLSSSAVVENGPAGVVVGTLSTTDPDAGDSHTYSLVSGPGSEDNASFAIAGSQLKTASSFDYETRSSYSVRIRTTDQGGLSTEQAFVIVVTNVNEQPTALNVSAANVPENQVVGTMVGTLSTTDPDAGDSHTYSLVSGPGSEDNASFAIAGSQLKTASSFDYESKSSYSIRVRTTDAGGLSYERALSIGVTDIDEVPPTSRVNSLAQRQTNLTFNVSVVGSDPASRPGEPVSGVASYDVYVSDQGGAWSLWQTVPASNPTGVFTAQSNHTYAFCSLARDVAGNIENKSLRIEASTYVPDLTPPETNVTTVDSSTSTFAVNFQGTDSGGSGLASFTVMLQVDTGEVQTVGTVPAGTPTGGVYQGSIAYQAIADGTAHTYRFYTLGADAGGNTEAAPGSSSDVMVTVRFDAPPALAVTAFDVQKGATQRSFVRYLGVKFNLSDQLATMIGTVNDADPNNNRIRLTRYGLDGTSNPTTVSLAGKAQAVDRVMAFDFGVQGIGGNANSNLGDGYYSLEFDLDNNGTYETVKHFYRLLGDVNGDRQVTSADLCAITAAFGRRGMCLEQDTNGDGIVDARDRLLACCAVGRKLGTGLLLDD